MCEKDKKPLEAAELTDDQLEDVAGGELLIVVVYPSSLREEMEKEQQKVVVWPSNMGEEMKNE